MGILGCGFKLQLLTKLSQLFQQSSHILRRQSFSGTALPPNGPLCEALQGLTLRQPHRQSLQCYQQCQYGLQAWAP